MKRWYIILALIAVVAIACCLLIKHSATVPIIEVPLPELVEPIFRGGGIRP